MARVETGHIHLHSFILHHTGGFETKSGEHKKNSKNTQKHKYGSERTCTATTQTKEEAATALLHASNKHAVCSIYNMKNLQNWILFQHSGPSAKTIQTDTHPHYMNDPLSRRKR